MIEYVIIKKRGRIMKKISGKFIGCLVYLCIGVFISLIYILCAATNNLEVTENTMSAIPSAILLTCFMVLPPLIWLIVIIRKKQVYTFDDDKNEISIKIDSYVNEFIQNKNIVTIIKNFVKTNGINLQILEFSFVPLKKITNMWTKEEQSYELKVNNLEKSSDYLAQLKLYNQNLIDNNFTICTFIDKFLNNTHTPLFNEEIRNSFNKLSKLYNSLINQQIVLQDDYINRLKAFMYLVYKYSKENICKEYETIAINNGLSVENTEYEIIKRLFNNGYDEETIILVLTSLNSKKHSYIDLFMANKTNYENIVNEQLKDLKEKQTIDNLLREDDSTIRYTIDDIDLMSGADFEKFITYMFNKLGYKATNTKLSGDQGVDIIAERGAEKIAIQTKCYSQVVGNSAVQEVYSGAKFYNATKCMVITNSYFTKSAKQLAKSNNVVLWDREVLKEKLKEI